MLFSGVSSPALLADAQWVKTAPNFVEAFAANAPAAVHTWNAMLYCESTAALATGLFPDQPSPPAGFLLLYLYVRKWWIASQTRKCFFRKPFWLQGGLILGKRRQDDLCFSQKHRWQRPSLWFGRPQVALATWASRFDALVKTIQAFSAARTARLADRTHSTHVIHQYRYNLHTSLLIHVRRRMDRWTDGWMDGWIRYVRQVAYMYTVLWLCILYLYVYIFV